MSSASPNPKKVPAYRRLADEISEEILDGRLREGDALPTEVRLCEVYGVNRSTVRECIRVLEEANMIRRENNSKKLYISRPSNQETGAQFERALMLQETSVGELWEAIVAIEPTIARLAAEKLDESILAQIDMNLELTEQAVKKKTSIIDLDKEFHTLIATMSANRPLNMARESISNFFSSSYQIVMSRAPIAPKKLLETHHAIANAIRSGNADEAESWMRKHVQDFENKLKVTGINIAMPMSRVTRLVRFRNT